MSRYLLEAWSWPPASTRIMDVPAAEHSGTIRLSGVGNGRALLPAGFERLSELINRDPNTPANDVRTVIRVWGDGDKVDPVYEWFPDIGADLLTDQTGQGIELTGYGIESCLSDAILLPFDYPADPTKERDWKFGGVNILRDGGFEKAPALNGGFEEGTNAYWQVTQADGFLTTAASIQAVKDAVEAEAGDFYGLLGIGAGARSGAVRTFPKLTPGATYTITAKLKDPTSSGDRWRAGIDGASSASHANAYLDSDYWWAELDNVAAPGGASDGTWQDFTLTFVAFNESIRLVIVHEGAAGPDFRLDSLTISGQAAGLSPWREVNASKTVIFESESTIVHSGSRSVKFQADDTLYVAPYGVEAYGYTSGIRRPVRLKDGQTYTGSVWVRQDSGAAHDYALILNRVVLAGEGAGGSHMASSVMSVPSGVWTELTVQGVADTRDVWFEIKWTYSGAGPLLSPLTYVDDAVLREGLAEATVGAILQLILDDATVDHVGDGWEVLDYLDYTSFTGVLDSNGDAWPGTEAITLREGKTYLQIVDHFAQLGYEWKIRWDSGTAQYRLYVYNTAGIGTDYSAAGTPAVVLGAGTTAGPVIHAHQRGNTILARGDGGLYSISANAGAVGAVGARAQYVVARDVTEQATLDGIAAQTVVARLLKGLSVGLTLEPSVTQSVPLRDYTVGDILTVKLPTIAGTVDRRLNALTYQTTDADDRYQAKFESEVFTGDNAVAEGVRWLLAKFEGITDELLDGGLAGGDGTGGVPTIFVAASDARDLSQQLALLSGGFVCDGTDDHLEIAAAAEILNTLGHGRLVLSEGLFDDVDAGMIVLDERIMVVGMGQTATVINPSGAGIVFDAGDDVTFRDFSFGYPTVPI